ncbi:MAG: T9SS C-terminal target domain-containing protein [Bacteroidetes bacterium]|nr:MAG: T9SS C-terminal target domain-containing protein [Bacteroidota bacterium]
MALRRSAATNLNNFATTSNNNLFFAGTPSTSNLIFFDGTNSDQTLLAYQTRVSTREANSVSENPTWQSTTGSSADFLKYSTSVASLADNAGGTGTGITTDFGGTTRSGSTPDMGAWELTITPLLSIANNGTQPSASNVNQGSTSNILQSFTITEGNLANATLNTVTIPLAGTYIAADMQASGLKLWRNTSNSFAGATAFTGVTATASGSGETATFSSLAFGITKNTTVYFWVTADISAIGINGNTINANALAPANFTFAVGVPTGSVSAGGAQTILTATPAISLASGTAPVSNPTQNTTNVVLYRVDVTVATTTAVLNGITFTTTGSYVASDLSNLKIWYHNNASFTTGTPVQIGSTKTTGLGAGAQSFTGLTQNYVVGTNYIFLTADMPCTATVANTISVNAIANVDATFASGTFGANTATGSGTVTINAVTLNNATAVTPTAGNTQVSLAWTAPAGCANEIMIVVAPASNTGSPTGDGSAYTANLAYSSGTALGNGFVAYKGSTSPQVITGLTNFTTYFFKVFTRNGTNWSSGVEVSAIPQPTYCATTYSSGCSGDYIDNVTFNTLSNLATGCTGNAGNGYRTVYPASGATTTSVEQGATYTLTLRPSSGFSEGFGVWIDYNKDGDFLDVGEFVAVSTTTTNGTDQNFSVSIPMSASLGLTAMRVRCFFNQTSGIIQSHACGAGATGFGEAEDYYITVSTPSPQTLGTIASAQATPATTNKNTTNNPILRIDLPTSGALGTLTLTNLVVTSANISDADVATNGVKLYYTTTTTFSTANPVGTGQSFASGTATFSGLTRLLANGNNYIWVAYDVATTATVGNTLDAQIAIGNMTIAEAGGATATGSVPVGALNPAGSVQIIPRAPLALTATAFSSSQINLSTTANADGDNIMVAWNSVNTFGTPTGTYIANDAIAGGGTVLYVGTVAGLVNHTGLTANTQYFYRVWTNGGTTYSTTFQNANATTLPNPLNYVFSQSNGTYGEITPTTTLFSGTFDNGLSPSQTIPSFTYNGVAYTNMFVSANGFLKLGGGTGPSGSNYTPLSTNSTAYQNIIAAFAEDLNHNGGGSATVGWSTVGNEIIVQWKNVRRFGVTGETVNFQIRMNTATGEINIVYGACTSGTSAETMQVGIRGFDETWRTQVSNRQGNLDWDKTTMGTNNTSALSMTTTNFPASGLTFTYTPNTCTPFPIIGAVTQSGSDVTVNWTAQAEAADGYDVRYRLQSAGIGTYSVVNVAGQASNSVVIPSLPAGTYLFEVRTRCSGSTFSDYSNAVVFNVLGNYYLKAGGVISTLTDWGSNTDGTGANPSALNEANAIWNIRNNASVNNPSAWTLGTASKIIVGDGASATNFTLPTGANVTGTIDVANLGTLTLQNTTNPTLGALAGGSAVDYNGTGAQTIAVANYSNLIVSGTRTGSPTITLASGTIDVAGTFSVTTTGVGSYTNTGNTVNFSSASMQTIPALAYRNITNTGNGNRTLASSGNISIANLFTPGSGTYTVTGSTVIYNSTSTTTYSLSTFTYNNLIITAGANPDYLITSGNTVTVLGNFQVNSGFFAVSNALSGTSTLNITGDCNIAGGTFIVTFYSGLGVLNVGGNLNVSGAGAMFVIDDTSAPTTTVTVNGNVSISGTGSINLEGTSSGSGVATLVCAGDFTATNTSGTMVDFGTGTVTNNEFRIGGNFSKSGAGTFTTTSSSTAKGFVFNKAGTQTFSYSGNNSQYTQYTVASGSTLQMLTGVTLPTSTSPTSTLTVNSGGTLDMGTQVITAGNTTDPIFTLASGGTIKTARATGLTTNFSGFGASRLVLSSLANYEFNGTVAQVTSAFVTTPTANTVNNLTINNSAGVTLTNDLTATNTLTMTAGVINSATNNRTLTLGTSAVSTGTLAYTSGTIVGKFKRWIAASATGYDFPVGIVGTTRNANITYTGAPTTGGSLTTQHIIGEAGTSGLPLNEGSITVTNVAKAIWQIDAGDGLTGGTYTATMNGTGLSGVTDFTKLVMLKRPNSGAWALEGSHVATTGSNGSPILQRVGLTGFSEFGVGGGSGENPLPITLISFTGERNGANVELDWRTSLEIDLKAYQVEKSYNGSVFTAVGKVEAKAGVGEKTYTFTEVENESAYYRLRYLHHNLPDEFSPVVFVRGGEDNRILVYPNPMAGKVKFAMNKQMQAVSNLTLHVLNAQGKIVATYKGDAKNIETQFNAEYSRWKAGVYMLQFQAQGAKQQTLKVVKP